jgi:hypothetical protein
MTSTAGFYKFDGELLRYASGAVYAPNFTLMIEEQQSYAYPVDGWRFFSRKEEAEVYFEINGQTKGRWVEFGAAVQVSAPVIQLMTVALEQHPPLGLGLAVGLGKAEDGKPASFLSSWTIARSLGMVTPEIAAELAELAQDFDLPANFVAALVAV